jgi:hypothetical protein
MNQTILNVYIVDGETGEIVADIDAESTVDAMAYFLRSRHVWPEATVDALTETTDHGFAAEDEFVTEGRNPIFGQIEWQYLARVH